MIKIYRLTGATFINQNYASLVAVYIGVNRLDYSSAGTYKNYSIWGSTIGAPYLWKPAYRNFWKPCLQCFWGNIRSRTPIGGGSARGGGCQVEVLGFRV